MNKVAILAVMLVTVPAVAAVDAPVGVSVLKLEAAPSENPVRKARKDLDQLNKEVESVDAQIAEIRVQAQAMSSITSVRTALMAQSENLQTYRAQLLAQQRSVQQQLQDTQ